MSKYKKLELTWVGKDELPRLEPRILMPEEVRSHKGAIKSQSNIFDNRLIFGDNLLALKALEQDYSGRIKCVFIDPPYNTGSAFEHYDDGIEHSIWLSLMRDRLSILWGLLDKKGSIWISIDDNELHYLKIICDELFGRASFISSVVWQKRTSPDARLQLGSAHDTILIYAKNTCDLLFNKIPLTEEQRKNYKNPDSDPRGPWVSTDFTAQGWRPNQMYKVVGPTGITFEPPPGRCWGNVEKEFLNLPIRLAQ